MKDIGLKDIVLTKQVIRFEGYRFEEYMCAVVSSNWGRGDRAALSRGESTGESLIELKFLKFDVFELILSLKLDKQFSIEQFEAAISQSTVHSPPLFISLLGSGAICL